jgi:hypothetical protein
VDVDRQLGALIFKANTFDLSANSRVRLWNVTSSMPNSLRKLASSPISGSPIVPVPTT